LTCLALLCGTAWVSAEERFITVASTTSTEQSGLFRHLLPAFEKATGIRVRVVALGTGQALDLARRCRRGIGIRP
jgi:tungstate transport system substrate-binding protein